MNAFHIGVSGHQNLGDATTWQFVAHQVHVFVAHDLEWDPLELDAHEEIRVQTYTIKEALDATLINNRCDPEAALILWLYARKRQFVETRL